MIRSIGIWTRHSFVVLVGIGAALAIFVSFAPQGRAGFQTALFVTQVLEVGAKPQSWFTAEPQRQEVSYPQATGTGLADIYRIPDGQQRAAVLIFLGANAAGRDDKDVVNLGNALARAGFVTMFHWSPTMALQQNIDPGEIDNLVWAFQYLATQDYVDGDRVGMGGFCVGAAFALVASADPRIRDDVVFLNAFGPYFDARDLLLLTCSSRSRMYLGQSTPWDVDQLTLRVFANELIETIQNPREQTVLRTLYMEGGPSNQADLEGLSPESRRVRQLLDGTTRQHAQEIYDSLPEDFRANMRRISPSAYVGDIKARLMIMHDRDDRLVPAAESRRLAAALEQRGDYRYTEVLAFDHVRPGSEGGVWELAKEGAKLYRHMYGIIREGA